MSDIPKNDVTSGGPQAGKATAPHEPNQLSTDELTSVTGGRTIPQDPSNSGGGFIPRNGVDPRII